MEDDYSLEAFDAVLRYSIDNPVAAHGAAEYITQAMGLNIDEFYDSMYVQRHKEDELRKAIIASPIVLVHGFPGTGKTTIVQKVIREINRPNDSVFLIKIDFKGKDKIPFWEANFNFSKWNQELIIQKIRSQTRISDEDIVKFVCEICETDGCNSELSTELINKLEYLIEIYDDLTSTEKFPDWVKNILANRSPLGLSAKELLQYVSLHNYLRYILEKENKQYVILLYDNTDTIQSDEIRNSFHEFIREFYGQVNDIARIVITSRTANISTDKFADKGAFPRVKVAIDYQEFTNNTLFKELLQKYQGGKAEPSAMDYHMAEERMIHDQKNNFAKKIVRLRSEFLKNKGIANLRKSTIYPVNENELNNIYELNYLIHSNSHLVTQFLDLSNYDRHYMLIHISDFIKYILQTLRLNLDQLGTSENEKSFILESYFYHWTINDGRMYKTSYYDIVMDYLFWASNKQKLGCSTTHLILSVIYNLTKKQRGVYDLHNKTTIGKVISKLNDLGFSEEEVIQAVYNLYKTDPDNCTGLLESNRFFSVNCPEDFQINDNIWLTPRSSNILDYLGYKFLFNISMLRQNKFIGMNGKKFDYVDNDPITRDTIADNLFFLCHLASMHINGLLEIKHRLNEKTDWFSYYRKWFCIKTDGSNGNGNLQLNNILSSHILFLKRVATIDNYHFLTNDMIEQYTKLQEVYNKVITDIVSDYEIPEITKNYFISRINFKCFSGGYQMKIF